MVYHYLSSIYPSIPLLLPSSILPFLSYTALIELISLGRGRRYSRVREEDGPRGREERREGLSVFNIMIRLKVWLRERDFKKWTFENAVSHTSMVPCSHLKCISLYVIASPFLLSLPSFPSSMAWILFPTTIILFIWVHGTWAVYPLLSPFHSIPIPFPPSILFFQSVFFSQSPLGPFPWIMRLKDVLSLLSWRRRGKDTVARSEEGGYGR